MVDQRFANTPVVVEQEVKDDAYEMGYNRYEGIEMDNPEDFAVDLTESAYDCNNTLPTLRAMAGFEDTAGGTYTKPREIILIDERDMDDRPIMGQSINSMDLSEELIDKYHEGALDAIRDD